MAKCNNCGATLSCGCQKRTFPDGKKGCSKCVNEIEKKVNNTNQTKSTS